MQKLLITVLAKIIVYGAAAITGAMAYGLTLFVWPPKVALAGVCFCLGAYINRDLIEWMVTDEKGGR